MLHKTLLFALLLSVGASQERFTCLRSEDGVYNSSSIKALESQFKMILFVDEIFQFMSTALKILFEHNYY